MTALWKILTRKKLIDPARAEESSLARVLNTFDLTALGVGSTLGVGMYVLVGKVAKETAGPAVILSFLIAAVASAFAGLCYAEFGARAPRAGSAYIYSYVCVGEFVAFIIGWNLILEYVIGSASVARGMSLYIDSLLNDSMKNAFMDVAPINVGFLSPYFDFLSFGIAVVLSVGLAFGMKESTKVNNVFTVLNIFVVLFVIIAGSTKAKIENWEVKVPTNVTDAGTGGFFPFGIGGMIKGAATCFYGFVGFDCIATTGEEVKNPQRAIPFAIIVSLLIVFLAYFGTSTVITLMVPYYLQDVNSPIPHAFEEFGWSAAKWIVTIGGIFALCASLFGAMFPLPRIIYAMATDGLIFKFLGKVSEKFSTPVVGTLLAGLLTGVMAAMFEQGQLVDMMSIGTLLAYTIVAACVLLLRYSVGEESYSLVHSDSDCSVNMYTKSADLNKCEKEMKYPVDDITAMSEDKITFGRFVKQIFNVSKMKKPSKLTQRLVTIEVCFYCLLCLLLGLCVIYLMDDISHGAIYAICVLSIIGFLMIIVLMSISTQPNSEKSLHFKVPFVPLIPALSILINIYLMLSLDTSTWIRFGVWMAIGLPIYFCSAPCNNKTAPHKVVAYKTDLNKSHKNYNTYSNYGFIDNEEIGSTNSDSAYFEENESCDDKTENVNESNVTQFSLDDLEKSKVRGSIDIGNGYDFRKLSLDTVSTNSNTILQENVIAIVHREDNSIIEVEESNDEEQEKMVVDNLEQMIKIEEEKLNCADVSTIENNSDSPPNSVGIIDTSNEHVIALKKEDSDSSTFSNTSTSNEELTEFESLNQSGFEEKFNNESEDVVIIPVPPPFEDFERLQSKRAQEAVQELDDVIQTEEDKLQNEIQDVPNDSGIFIPVPPPMEDFENLLVSKIPRIPKKRYSRNKKRKPYIPPPDYDEDTSSETGVDIIKLGSEQHQRLKSKLTAIFGNRGKQRILTRPQSTPKEEFVELRRKSLAPIMDRVISEIPTNANEDNNGKSEPARDSGGVEVLEKEDIKKKLNALFSTLGSTTLKQKSATLSRSNGNLENTSDKENVVKQSQRKNSRTFPRSNNFNKDHDTHKVLMQNTLNSIKLRKLRMDDSLES